tara:strand:- start:1167 stop:1430 length:264 start_codon:yes stop_codon:yes gene_type:complete
VSGKDFASGELPGPHGEHELQEDCSHCSKNIPLLKKSTRRWSGARMARLKRAEISSRQRKPRTPGRSDAPLPGMTVRENLLRGGTKP